MICNTVFSVLFLLVVWPVVVMSVPVSHLPNRKSKSGFREILDDQPQEKVYDQSQGENLNEPPERWMNELTGNQTVCPFVETNRTTEGIPEIVFEYSCVSQVTNGKADNSFGRCQQNHQCVQGTTTILIKVPNKVEPIPRQFNSGCFCARQTGSAPNYVAQNSTTN